MYSSCSSSVQLRILDGSVVVHMDLIIGANGLLQTVHDMIFLLQVTPAEDLQTTIVFWSSWYVG